MRRIVCIMLALITSFIVCACGLINSEGSIAVNIGNPDGRVTIISDGHQYSPVRNMIYELRNNLAVDCMRKDPEEMDSELSEIIVSEDFRIDIKGKIYSAPDYLIYSLAANDTYNTGHTFNKPTENGEYIVRVEIGWGDKKRYIGYQYFFKIVVQE